MRPCPVCGTPGGSVERVVAAHVWAALEEEFGVRVPGTVRSRHAPNGAWGLVTCPGCGLQHFADAAQGDAEFYALLTASPRYYEANRWEFGVVRSQMRRGSAIVDIGCGAGAFLLSLPRDFRRTGLDHNGPALAALRAADPSVIALTQDAGEHADEVGDRYDAVTAFQVLEHVEHPRALLHAAARLVRPDGSVYVSVPHQDRSGRAAFEVLDHPPHHLTRWRLPQVLQAAQAEGLEVAGTWYEPPDESVRMAALTECAERRLRAVPSAPRRQLVRLARRTARLPVVRAGLLGSGWYLRKGLSGHTMLVRLVRR